LEWVAGQSGAAGRARSRQKEPRDGVRFLARIIQFILWLILATWLGRKLLGWLFGTAGQDARVSPARAPQKLYRDPYCGTFVSPEISFSLEHAGQLHHFCCAECRERYRQSLRHAGHAATA
jgi:YHS domain-containing protein